MIKISEIHYKKNLFSYLLLPFAIIYSYIIRIRHWLYKKNWFKSHKLPVPVIVVGNITLGGTGKTPLVIYLANLLRKQGHKPGIISRGYGAKAPQYPCFVSDAADPLYAGDEPVLMATHTLCPIAIDPNRPRAAKYLIENFACNIIISDDGLQHYALQRDIEIAVIDGMRKFGNGFLFPAGPLRELQERLQHVDFIVVNNAQQNFSLNQAYFSMNFEIKDFVNLQDQNITLTAADFKNRHIHAVAGIGNPERFFQTLKSMGLHIIEHPFPDHHVYIADDLNFNDDLAVIMTEKDAVKCKSFAKRKFWCLPITAKPEEEFERQFLGKFLRTVNFSVSKKQY